MKFKETATCRALRQALALGLLAGVAAAPALAQETQTLQRVEVTGSNIKRVDAESASPVLLISAQDIARAGKATVAEYLQTLGVDGAGSLPTSFGNGFAAGSTAVSLRGLGATSTLVLLNGRRMAPFGRADDGQKTFTDLSTIPMELVERIEILKDGASSVYGADAIAGVVNIILKKDFTGHTFQMSTGISRYGDAKQHKASLTGGYGDLLKDGYNLVFNAEWSKNDRLQNSDRAGREYIGHADLRPWGYGINTQFARGYITGNNNANESPVGLIRNPTTLDYVALPGCAALSVSTPQDPKGGCVWHYDQFRSMQPEIQSTNLYAGGTAKLGADLLGYFDVGYSSRSTSFLMIPPTITPTVAFPPNAAYPSGVINYGSGAGTTIMMAATHPQNPFGAAARIRYVAFDVGPQERKADNKFSRVLAGVKGSAAGWDFDAGVMFSKTALTLEYTNSIRMDVLKAALGDPTSKWFPYFIGSQAFKNSKDFYDALRTSLTADLSTELKLVDVKASRELMQLEGGALGLAIGAEYRSDKLDAPSLSGTETGLVNASYVAAKGESTVKAAYVELLAPVLKGLELSGAIRYDKYDKFDSTTPKLGVKWTPMKSLALRGTYSEGFRAPGAAESGAASQSTGTATARDPIRCPNGTPAAGGGTTADCSASIAAVKVGDPNLQPEKSKGMTLGLLWDTPMGTSVAVDGWKIKRSNEINPLPYAEAAALPTAIRADNNLVVNGQVVPNSGTLLISKAPYRNSSYTEVKGIDIDLKHRFNLGDMGRLTLGANWTHLLNWTRVEPDSKDSTGKVTPGKAYEYAGTHGNCDTSNCIGTPRDKINLNGTWDLGSLSMSGLLNYRSAIKNIAFAGDPCASKLADGSDGPNAQCRIGGFYTLDVSVRYQFDKSLQVFGSIQNLTDRIAPLDPFTYGTMSYNPMDYSGAIGRYYKVGLKYQF
ncbi:TonB-dependent receptor [Pelomonas sp. SE-A7]|uniref:TonB-dependent receptor n=1 Tax=Pelomonas sp. SE-A7 TaxID=3054953 RepID=UPI00259CF6F7|nr:TonB-dependent receptor [Pelomonas sp. SE-A7]MDM4768213.1 TonB-dependent receptor [Pelomonas sp. SE-A7]